MRAVASIACVALGLTACTLPQPPQAPQITVNPPPQITINPPPPPQITVTSDSYQPYIEYKSNVVTYGPSLDQQLWVLVAHQDRKTGEIIAFVQWASLYVGDGWRFYQHANSDGGAPLEFRQVSRDVSYCGGDVGCDYEETYNIYLTPARLKRAPETGFSFKVFARDGSSRIVSIPPEIFAMLREKIAQSGHAFKSASSTMQKSK